MRKKKVEFPKCETCPKRTASVFCDLSEEEVTNMSANKGCNFYKRGQNLFYEGSRAIGVHCIYEGKVKLTKLGIDGKEQIVKIASDGEVLGYNSLLSQMPYNISAEALDDAVVCFLPTSTFSELIDNNKDFPRKMMQVMAKDTQDMEQRLTNWMQKSVRERLAEVLLLLHNRYQDKEKPQVIDVRLSREEIANLVGTATESAIRYLSELNTDKIIQLKGKEIIILDREKLLKVANIDMV
ncbi:cAMP-binding protein [Bernardetia litoralis DSM 6794]|uniref:cAMP-binding protein n=1 Tax=Bernardetia litoralis (strain ATCC 23117 / DSM 6794 / NBRC 15988 / NCIMB 1366 / Fx l1 / Sio-4) TaxID=880071 RepID=I4AGL7_BERLS|nr:Crp/Fnr family transcriptional regulator [Bernardetia litoralis]AFM03102.1 cAMP-binding protein [Bernardetia litoralis DSM 6794]